jgi:hypothetical protein
MFSKYFFNFNNMLNVFSIKRYYMFKLIGAASIIGYTNSSLILEFPIVFLAPIHINKMVLLNESIVTSLKLVSHFLLMLQFRIVSGVTLSRLLVFSLIDFLVVLFI